MNGRWLSGTSVLAFAASAAGLSLSGCGGASTVKSVVDPVAQAAQLSELAPGFRASIIEEATPPGSSEPVTVSGTGVFDQRGHRGSVTMHIAAEGHSTTAQTRYSDLAVYMRLPSSSTSSPVTHGKPWIKLDLTGVSQALGISFASLTSNGASSNPKELLSYLKAASGQVTKLGAEDVQGVPATHYRGTIDYKRYASLVPPTERAAAEQSAAAVEHITGSDTQGVDVWIDSQHRVRREELTFHECLPEAKEPVRIHLRIEFRDFGIHAIPQPPPNTEVADVTAHVAEKLKHIKLGCQ
jgi:hypothetical protein